jgi:hypothetical protein
VGGLKWAGTWVERNRECALFMQIERDQGSNHDDGE